VAAPGRCRPSRLHSRRRFPKLRLSPELMHPRRWITYALTALVCWGLGHCLFITIDGLTDSPEPADAAVILGNTVNPDGTLSVRLAQRLRRGLELYRAGQVKRLIVSGGLGREGFYEGTKMGEYLRQQGVPDSALIVDNHGNTTQQTVRNVLLLRDSLHFTRLLVVSQYYHLTRTKMLFRRAGFARVGSASPRYFEWRDVYSLAREFGAYYTQLLAAEKTKDGPMLPVVSKPGGLAASVYF